LQLEPLLGSCCRVTGRRDSWRNHLDELLDNLQGDALKKRIERARRHDPISPSRLRVSPIGFLPGQAVMKHSHLSAVVGVWMVLASAVLMGCGGQPAGPSRPPDPALPVPIDSQGPVRITFVAATIAPGSTITGCGPLIEGCADRASPPSTFVSE
jgi:hypothetical protein